MITNLQKSIVTKIPRDVKINKLKIKLYSRDVTNICNFFAKSMNIDITSMDSINSIRYDNFDIKIVSKPLPFSLGKSLKQYEDIKVMTPCEAIITDKYGYSLNIYTVLGGKISSKFTKNQWKKAGDSTIYKILDFHYMIGYLKMLDIVIEYFKNDTFILDHPEYTVYKINYKANDIDKLIHLENHNKLYLYHREILVYLIHEVLILMKDITESVELNNEYSRSGNYAKSYMTKKTKKTNITKEAMSNNTFNNFYEFVELDEMTDINKFRALEKEFLELSNRTNFFDLIKCSGTKLRFRKLGQHKVNGYPVGGLYYYNKKCNLNCICIDLKSPHSFIHENGHALDKTYSSNCQLSLTEDFFQIIEEYKYSLRKQLEGDNKTLDQKMWKYLCTPTEIFARTLEIYFMRILKESSFVDNSNLGDYLMGYPSSEKLYNLIDNYFGNIIKLNNPTKIIETIDCQKQLSFF